MKRTGNNTADLRRWMADLFGRTYLDMNDHEKAAFERDFQEALDGGLVETPAQYAHRVVNHVATTSDTLAELAATIDDHLEG